MDLSHIANRIISRYHKGFGGVRGWLYPKKGGKFVDLMERDSTLHQNFARKHILEDIGFKQFLEDHHEEWPDGLVSELEDAADSYIFSSISGSQAQQVIDLLIKETALTEKIRDRYINNPEKAYSEDYDAIRIWIMQNELIADYYGWNENALLSLQNFVMDETAAQKPNLKIILGDYKFDKIYKFTIEDLLAYTGKGKSLISSKLHRIAARIAFFGPGSIRGWLYTDNKYTPLSDKNSTNHYEFARKHVLEDAGYNEFYEKRDLGEEIAPDLSHMIWYYIDHNPEFLVELINHTSLTKEVFDRYNENAEKAYSKDYNAIRIWVTQCNNLLVSFTGWNLDALRAVQKFLNNHPSIQNVYFEDYENNDNKIHPVKDVLKWRGTNRIFAFNFI